MKVLTKATTIENMNKFFEIKRGIDALSQRFSEVGCPRDFADMILPASVFMVELQGALGRIEGPAHKMGRSK